MAANILSLAGSHTAEYTTVTGGTTAGILLVVGAVPMVPLETTTSAGVVVACQVGGAVLLPKKAAASTNVAAFGRVYYMTTGGVNKGTGVAAAGKMIGYAMEAAATGATTVKVQLIAGPMPLETQA